MSDRLAEFPSALKSRARLARLGPSDTPAMIAHPDWETSAPVMIWMHGRTVSKETDPGRYLRWVRAGIAACALDLPGHGEREEARLQEPTETLEVLERMLGEIDGVVAALSEGAIGDKHRPGIFDADRIGIGGMSAGGMAALRRLCDPHPFRCAAVEGTSGWLGELYHPTLEGNAGRPWAVDHAPAAIEPLDPAAQLDGFRPIPLLALHSEADRMVPFAGQRAFIDRLRAHYRGAGADPGLIELRTWPETGAPGEHAGFGRFSSQAKAIQTEFLARCLGEGS